MPKTQSDQHLVEKRVLAAVDAFGLRKNATIKGLAAEFNIDRNRLRRRLRGKPSASEVRGLHTRALTPAQDEALSRFIRSLDNIDCPLRFRMLERAAVTLFNEAHRPDQRITRMGPHWCKRWLSRHSGIRKMKRKPLPFHRKNASDIKILERHFELFKTQRDEYNIQLEDTWNFDETGFRIGVTRADWVVTAEPRQRSYSGSPITVSS